MEAAARTAVGAEERETSVQAASYETAADGDVKKSSKPKKLDKYICVCLTGRGIKKGQAPLTSPTDTTNDTHRFAAKLAAKAEEAKKKEAELAKLRAQVVSGCACIWGYVD